MLKSPAFYRISRNEVTSLAKRIGIIGAGQLGAYLCQAARELEFTSTILTPDETSPACSIANNALIAAYDDTQALVALCENSDVITFEFEDVPESTLRFLEDQSAAKVFPSPATIRLLQNKGLQKTWLKDQGFATSEFILCDEAVSYSALVETLGDKFVQKALTGGFDGRGVQIIGAHNADELWQSATLAEAFVTHDLELAVLVCRSVSGELMSYPVVELSFSSEANVLLLANSPARISAEVEAKARSLGEKVVSAMSGVGIFAVELFLTPEGELLVNEISPRVHNSGHMTIEAHDSSQYEQHIRAVFDADLQSQAQHSAVAMTNLLYSDNLESLLGRPFSSWTQSEHSVVHWYGKVEGRLGRKMGHITTTAQSLDLAISKALKVQEQVELDGGN